MQLTTQIKDAVAAVVAAKVSEPQAAQAVVLMSDPLQMKVITPELSKILRWVLWTVLSAIASIAGTLWQVDPGVSASMLEKAMVVFDHLLVIIGALGTLVGPLKIGWSRLKDPAPPIALTKKSAADANAVIAASTAPAPDAG